MSEMPFELEDGSIVYVEVEEPEGGMRRVSRGGEEKEAKAAKRFSDAMAHIRPAAQMVLDSFREMNTPDEIAMEFGLKFNAKLGTAVLASVDSTATFKVSIKWTNPKA